MNKQNKQPKPLRLADELDSLVKHQLELGGDGKKDKAAATELRRLYAENERLKAELKSAVRVHGLGRAAIRGAIKKAERGQPW